MNKLSLFLTNARAKHGYKYNYSKVEYTNNKTKVCIICPEHGEFWQEPSRHNYGQGCPSCGSARGSVKHLGLNNEAKKLMYSAEQFITKAREVHGDKYDYTHANCTSSRSVVRIVCPEHGEFLKRAEYHITAKQGCPACKQKEISIKNTKSQDYFITKAREVHGSKYGYSKSKYVKKDSKVIITCPEHGDFLQTPNKHHAGQGCPECAATTRTKKNTKGLEQFVEDSRKIYGDLYDYSKAEYTHSGASLIIVCPTHGSFNQTPSNHLKGRGCPYCQEKGQSSKVERLIYNHLTNLGLTVVRNTRQVIPPLELDVYLPEHKLAIEYCGLYWHSETQVGKKRHAEKLERCNEAGIKLITVFSDEFIRNPALVLSSITHKAGLTRKDSTIYGRNCRTSLIDTKTAKDFLSKNHLQGADTHRIAYGLMDKNDQLVALLTMAMPSISGGDSNCEWNVSRYCVLQGHSVVGGFQKLFKQFLKDYTPNSVLTYADLRWSSGELYIKSGFEFVHNTAPNYWYFKTDNKRYHRYNFRKSLLKRKLECYDDSMTEYQNMAAHGWQRVWDCGNAKFIWRPSPPS